MIVRHLRWFPRSVTHKPLIKTSSAPIPDFEQVSDVITLVVNADRTVNSNKGSRNAVRSSKSNRVFMPLLRIGRPLPAARHAHRRFWGVGVDCHPRCRQCQLNWPPAAPVRMGPVADSPEVWGTELQSRRSGDRERARRRPQAALSSKPTARLCSFVRHAVRGIGGSWCGGPAASPGSPKDHPPGE